MGYAAMQCVNKLIIHLSSKKCQTKTLFKAIAMKKGVKRQSKLNSIGRRGFKVRGLLVGKYWRH